MGQSPFRLDIRLCPFRAFIDQWTCTSFLCWFGTDAQMKFYDPVALKRTVLERNQGERFTTMQTQWVFFCLSSCPFLGTHMSDIRLWHMRNWHVFTFWSLIFGLLLHSKLKNRYLKHSFIGQIFVIGCVFASKNTWLGQCPSGCQAVLGCFTTIPAGGLGVAPMCFKCSATLKPTLCYKLFNWQINCIQYTTLLLVEQQEHIGITR